jgi:hypothetical protein
LGAYVYYHKDYLPAPRYTGNVALNEKLLTLSALPKDSIEVIAVGSSMTLNNLASSPVVELLGTRAYVNLGAWGLGIRETTELLPAFVDRLRPSTVILVTNLMDFEPQATLSNEEIATVVHKLQEGRNIWDHLRYWDSPWFLRQMELNRIRYHDRGNYEFLGFDEHGAATLEVPKERILPSRFDEQPPKAKDLDSTLYTRVEEMAGWLRARDIDLILLRSPYRQGLQTPQLKELDQLHGERLQRILAKAGHRSADGNEFEWADSLFNDASHLDRAGAEAFTRWALERALMPNGAGTGPED